MPVAGQYDTADLFHRDRSKLCDLKLLLTCGKLLSNPQKKTTVIADPNQLWHHGVNRSAPPPWPRWFFRWEVGLLIALLLRLRELRADGTVPMRGGVGGRSGYPQHPDPRESRERGGAVWRGCVCGEKKGVSFACQGKPNQKKGGQSPAPKPPVPPSPQHPGAGKYSKTNTTNSIPSGP